MFTDARVVVFLAVGDDSHRWPLCRSGRSSPFVPAVLERHARAALAATSAAAAALVPRERRFGVVAGDEPLAAALFPDVPAENVVVTPRGFGSLSALALATVVIERRIRRPLSLLVLFTDAVAAPPTVATTLLSAFERAEAEPCLASVPLAPSVSGSGVLGDDVERPPASSVRDNRFDAGSRVFAWETHAFWATLRRNAPLLAGACDRLRRAVDRQPEAPPIEAFAPFRNLSLGGLLAHVPSDARIPLRVVHPEAPWYALDRLSALARLVPPDTDGNRVLAEGASVRVTAHDSIVVVLDARNREIVIEGVSSALVCLHGDDLLVASRAAEADVDRVPSSPFDLGTRVPNGVGPVKRVGAANSSILDADTPGVVALVGDISVHVHVSPRRLLVRGMPAVPNIRERPPRSRVAVTVDQEPERAEERFAAALVLRLRQLAEERVAPVVALAAGATMLRVYDRLAREFARAVPWGRFTVVQMNEYVGFAPTDPRSIQFALRRQFASPLGVGRFLGIDGGGTNEEFGLFEQRIAGRGIDVALHGIGSNGRLAFVEPFRDWLAPGGRVFLAPETQVETKHVAAYGFTLSLPTLHAASTILALAIGDRKCGPVDAAILQPPSTGCPASSLQRIAVGAGAPRVSLFLDRAAGASFLAGQR